MKPLKLGRDCYWLCGDIMGYRTGPLLIAIYFEVIFGDYVDEIVICKRWR
jgi:hypothetical protein